MIINLRKFTSSLLLLAICSGCSFSIPFGSSCSDRNGACFDASIDGMAVTKLKDRSLLSKYEKDSNSASLKVDLQKVDWTVEQPVSGKLEVQTAPNKKSADWFKGPIVARVELLPLAGQVISSIPAAQVNSKIRANGNSTISGVNVIDQKMLPPGDYLVRIRANGPGNWDLKSVFVTIQ